jgi:hypothetical protein
MRATFSTTALENGAQLEGVARYLAKELDRGYASQFVGAPSTSLSFPGMPTNGGFYWQYLQMRREMLNSLIVELRRGG